MLIAPRPEYLATSTERQVLDVIAALEEKIATNPSQVSQDVRLRMKRLRGIVTWQVRTEYDQRFTDAYNNLISLDEIIKQLKITYNSFIRTRQAATQSYEGYTIPIRQLRTRLFTAQRTLKGVMAKQGRLLETMAINELDRRRKRLEEYQIKARFALAESYDRATKAQLDAEIAKQDAGVPDEVDKQPEVTGKNAAEEEAVIEEESLIDPETENDEAAGSSSFKQQLLGR